MGGPPFSTEAEAGAMDVQRSKSERRRISGAAH